MFNQIVTGSGFSFEETNPFVAPETNIKVYNRDYDKGTPLLAGDRTYYTPEKGESFLVPRHVAPMLLGSHAGLSRMAPGAFNIPGGLTKDQKIQLLTEQLQRLEMEKAANLDEPLTADAAGNVPGFDHLLSSEEVSDGDLEAIEEELVAEAVAQSPRPVRTGKSK
jgi:hypothetical protein